MIDDNSLIVIVVGRGLLGMLPLDVVLPCLVIGLCLCDVLLASVIEGGFGAATMFFILLLPGLFPQ